MKNLIEIREGMGKLKISGVALSISCEQEQAYWALHYTRGWGGGGRWNSCFHCLVLLHEREEKISKAWKVRVKLSRARHIHVKTFAQKLHIAESKYIPNSTTCLIDLVRFIFSSVLDRMRPSIWDKKQVEQWKLVSGSMYYMRYKTRQRQEHGKQNEYLFFIVIF